MRKQHLENALLSLHGIAADLDAMEQRDNVVRRSDLDAMARRVEAVADELSRRHTCSGKCRE